MCFSQGARRSAWLRPLPARCSGSNRRRVNASSRILRTNAAAHSPITLRRPVLALPVYVSRLYAVEGDREHGCANERARAFTAPGSRVIHLCSAHFDTTSGIVNAQMTIIHEIPHTRIGREPAVERSDHAAGDRALQGVFIGVTAFGTNMPAAGHDAVCAGRSLHKRSSWASTHPE